MKFEQYLRPPRKSVPDQSLLAPPCSEGIRALHVAVGLAELWFLARFLSTTFAFSYDFLLATALTLLLVKWLPGGL